MNQNQNVFNIINDEFINGFAYDYSKADELKVEEYPINYLNDNCNNHPIVNNNNLDTTKTYEQLPMIPCVNDQYSNNQCPVLTSPFTPQDEQNWDQNHLDITKSREFHQINHQTCQFQSHNILDTHNILETHNVLDTHNILDINKPIEFPLRFVIPGYEIIIQPTCSPFVNNTQNHFQHYYEQNNNIFDNSQFNQPFDSEIFNNC